MVGEAVRLGNPPKEFRQMWSIGQMFLILLIFALVFGVLTDDVLFTLGVFLFPFSLGMVLIIRKEYFVRPSFVTLANDRIVFEYRLRRPETAPWTSLRDIVVWTGERRFGGVKVKGCALGFNDGQYPITVTYDIGMRIKQRYKEKTGNELPEISPY